MKNAYKQIIAAVAGVAGIVLVVLTVSLFSQGSAETELQQEVTRPSVYLEKKPVPVAVSGLVEPADAAVLSAQAAGMLVDVYAREGSFVLAGEPIARVSTPVAAAQLQQANLEVSLSGLQQKQQVLAASYDVAKAIAESNSKQTIAQLRAVANDASVQQAAQSLAVALEGHLAQMVLVLDFIDNNQEYFDADAEDAYEAVVISLYGNLPDHFGEEGGVRVLEQADALGLKQLLSDAQAEGSFDVAAVADVAYRLQIQSEALGTVLSSAEADVFGERGGGVATETYDTYTSARASFYESMSTLTAQQSLLTTTADGVLENAESTRFLVEVSALDEAQAADYEAITRNIELVANEVARAAAGVAAAQVELGVIRAPFSGTVSVLHADIGTYVQPGVPVVTFMGEGATEVTVTLPPAVAGLVSEAETFAYGENYIGTVMRVGAPDFDGSRLVVISLGEGGVVGDVITGEIMTTLAESVYAVPRGYVHFDSLGALVRSQSDHVLRTEIVYDAGDWLYVAFTTEPFDEPLTPVVSAQL